MDLLCLTPIRSVYQFRYTDISVYLNWYTNQKQRNSSCHWSNSKKFEYINGFIGFKRVGIDL